MNGFKTLMLLSALTALLMALGFTFGGSQGALIALVVALTYSAGVNYQDVFSQVRTWDVIIYNYLSENNIIIPPKKRGRKNEQYAGA